MAVTESRRRTRLLWSTAAVVALLWPARTLGLLDGVPLDNRVEALLVGLVLPALWWLDRSVFDRRVVRGLVAGLLVAKLSTLALTQAGFCTQFHVDRPIVGPIEAIEFEDRTGDLPSWDARAGANCSAITARPYHSRADFPAWFVNLVDNTYPPQPRVAFETHGVVSVTDPGSLTVFTAPEMSAVLEVDGHAVAPSVVGRSEIALETGLHDVSIRAVLSGSTWTLVPLWNGRNLWSAAQTTIAHPVARDVVALNAVGPAITLLALALLGSWIVYTGRNARLRNAEWGWIALATTTMLWLGHTRFDRLSVLLLFGVAWLPAVARRANLRGAFLLVGIPWLALFAWPAFDLAGRFSIYTHGDDWLTYQISAYRIFKFGAWLEAGEKAFYYQPLYRWICGALHMVFGDSSVGELYWDATCLLVAALLAFRLSRPAGRRWAFAAAAATLSVASLGPVWHLIGRGLAEISAGGFLALACLWLMRARHGSLSAAALAGVFAVLAYYCRLNHMLLAAGLIVVLLPTHARARDLRSPRTLLRRIRPRVVVAYGSVLALGVLLLAARTWYYGGRFSVFQGSSLAINYTGFEPAKVLHSLMATMIANEAFDPRGLPILAGVVAALLAILQVALFDRLSLAPSLLCLAGLAGAFIAHAHGYPGRFSVHMLPASTAVVIGLVATVAAPMVRHGPAAPAAPEGVVAGIRTRATVDRAR
jgi:hypothetical protein